MVVEDHEAGVRFRVQYFPNLDWIRLTMATLVVAIHSGVATSLPINPVPSFIAISGFVVMGSVKRNSPASFARNRALRVLPALLVSFAVVGLVFGIDEFTDTVTYWLLPLGHPPVNAVVWSLMHEEVLYLCLGLFFYSGASNLGKWTAPVSAAMCGVAAFVTKTYDLVPHIISMFLMLAGAFLVGVSGHLYRNLINLVPARVAVSCLVIACAVGLFLPYDRVLRPEFLAIEYLSYLCLIVAAVVSPQLPRLSIDLSYSLYLFHCIVRALLLPHLTLGWAMFFLMMILTLPISLLSWYAIEKPALKLKHWRQISEPSAAK